MWTQICVNSAEVTFNESLSFMFVWQSNVIHQRVLKVDVTIYIDWSHLVFTWLTRTYSIFGLMYVLDICDVF